MARKVILDVDPGIDDAVALAIALFDPRLDVIAVTATAGSVSAKQATRNVEAVIELLDPPRLPRIGVAPTDVHLAADARHMNGANGLGDAEFAVAELHNRHAAEKVICDEIRADPGNVTVLTLGPLTNLARVLVRDPELGTMLRSAICCGGTYLAAGDVTAAAEFNVYCDPAAAAAVFHSSTNTTMVPLDVTQQLIMTYDLADQLPSIETRVGKLLHQILPYSFRAHRQHLGLEGVYQRAAVALMVALHPELFEVKVAHVDVETSGSITTGATIFDRRMSGTETPNVEVVVSADMTAVLDGIMRGLAVGK